MRKIITLLLFLSAQVVLFGQERYKVVYDFQSDNIFYYSLDEANKVRDTLERPRFKKNSTVEIEVLNVNPFAVEIIRPEKEDLLNFHAVFRLESAEDNPGITRLSFDELRIFFSKTKVFQDENLNARLSILIKGQWRGEDGTPMADTLIEQEYDLRNLKYGAENQIKTPILSHWYYDIPIVPDVEDNSSFGIVEVSVQLEEYEGKKSKYINQLPSILSDNKKAIIKSGSSTIKKITGGE